MENIDLLKKKYLTQTDYQIIQNYENINLYDNVILYNIGNNKFRIVDLNIMLSYPIIYDVYQLENKIEDITIVVCPLSLRSIVLEGKFKINSYIDTLLILEDSKDNIIPINMKNKIDSEHIIYPNKRYDVKIMKLKNALIYSSDSTFIVPNDNIKIKSIIDQSYYHNKLNINNEHIQSKYHPKTLCYLIYYKKIAILIGKDKSTDDISGYNLDKSGLTHYLNKNYDKFTEKELFIMPILLYVAIKEYKNLYKIPIL